MPPSSSPSRVSVGCVAIQCFIAPLGLLTSFCLSPSGTKGCGPLSAVRVLNQSNALTALDCFVALLLAMTFFLCMAYCIHVLSHFFDGGFQANKHGFSHKEVADVEFDDVGDGGDRLDVVVGEAVACMAFDTEFRR